MLNVYKVFLRSRYGSCQLFLSWFLPLLYTIPTISFGYKLCKTPKGSLSGKEFYDS